MTSADEVENELERERARRAAGRSREARNLFAGVERGREVFCVDCKCRVTLCGFAWAFAKQASTLLLARGERELQLDEMTRCVDCGERFERYHREQFETRTRQANQAQRDANGQGLVDQQLVAAMRREGYHEWAKGIEDGAAAYLEQQTTKGRSRKEGK